MLKDVVKKILKTANLEEVTMKTVCKQVCRLPASRVVVTMSEDYLYIYLLLHNLVVELKWRRKPSTVL